MTDIHRDIIGLIIFFSIVIDEISSSNFLLKIRKDYGI